MTEDKTIDIKKFDDPNNRVLIIREIKNAEGNIHYETYYLDEIELVEKEDKEKGS